jgi:hypothetical protein
MMVEISAGGGGVVAADGGAAAAAAAAHHARIKKMVGPVAFCDPQTFLGVVSAAQVRTVAWSHQGWFGKRFHYLTTALGLTWYCKTAEGIRFDPDVVLIEADKITVPE